MDAPEQLPAELSEINGNAAASERDQENENGVSKKDRKRKITNNAVAVRRSNRCRGQVKRSRDNYSIVATGTEKLDSGTFDRYLMHIWNAFPEEKVKSFTYLDPLWFCMYAHEDYKRKASVLSWIKKKDIFTKKYVFVPIVMGSHWSLLIFCNLGESVRRMLLLDSLQATGSTELRRDIRSFLIDIYRSEERPETKKQLSKIPFLIPKVPQQKNGDECGFYVLYYMHLFIERAHESFNVCKGSPDFMKKDWFSYEEVEAFKKSLNDLPIACDRDSDDSSDCVEVSHNHL